MLSKIEQVEMLIALGKGDKYRLMHIREILERGKELYISDKDFLQNLVKTHLKDRIYQARVVSTTEKPKQFCENCASEISADEMFCTNCGAVTQAPSSPPTLDVPEPTPKPNLFCENCASEISADEKFCTSCGTQKPEPSTSPTADVSQPTPEPQTKLRAHGHNENVGFPFTDDGNPFEIPITKSFEGFTFTNDGDIGEITTRKSAQQKPKPKKKSRQQELEEYESKHIAKSGKQHTAKGFTITDSGEIGQTSTKKTVRRKSRIKSKPTPRQKPKKKSRQQELEQYEKKHLNEPQTTSSWKAYDVKAKKSVEIQNPKVVKMKNGKWAVKGTSPITGIKVFRIVGNEKPTVSSEKTKISPKVEKVVSRYYRPPIKDDSLKAKRSKSKKPNLFCEECGSKIATKDIFCTNCGAKR